ncbi:Negative regulator of sexual conjugation and meiosis [Lecanosticta acicola]|uniref:Negative regulator of sexual conjugation and meiosis n=1 Tax=Lecanosticta acicola TaxID=111012 RepID=A0AAI8YVC6_9PEZI|nr:Negative regulator of sexual conjugation and meiosis [Lecanosticta acicola]
MLPTPPPSPSPLALCSPGEQVGAILAGSIQLTEVIGVGAYGTVYRARDLVTNLPYAVKALPKLGLDPRQKAFQDREIRLHYQASQHPNVVSLLKILDSPECTYVVLEYCKEGDLFAKITEDAHYVGDDFKAKQVFLQLISAVQHCHSKGIYHRDLKPENVLVEDNGWTVKLADFGLATQERITSDYGCGSTFYMSPECQQSSPKPFSCYASAPNDVWSLGVILVNLTCGRNPWKRACLDDNTFKTFMRDRNFLKTILPISDDLDFILQRIFDLNPHHRVTLDELRDLVIRCPRFTTQGSSAPSTAPPTPPYSPMRQPVDSPLAAFAGACENVPHLDLPAQRYPPTPPPEYYSQQPPLILTPPSSGQCSPQASVYPLPPKPVAPVASSGNLFAHFPDLRRCGQMFANFNMPAQHAWTPQCF